MEKVKKAVTYCQNTAKNELYTGKRRRCGKFWIPAPACIWILEAASLPSGIMSEGGPCLMMIMVMELMWQGLSEAMAEPAEEGTAALPLDVASFR